MISMTAAETAKAIASISEVIKRRFPNLTVTEVIKLASEIVQAINA